MIRSVAAIFGGAALVICGAFLKPTFAQTAASNPQAMAPYELTVFATAPAAMSAPDSIAVLHHRVFVGYGDGHAPDGSDGKNSQIVEYRMDGSIAYVYTVPGHNDGLKVNPQTHLLWALQNEDSTPNLVLLNTETHERKQYGFAPTLHGGGYDDIVFRGCQVYISASNPANNPNSGPAIVSARLEGDTVVVEPMLAGEANAVDIPTDGEVVLNLQDPDSMTLDPLGDIVLDSQGDQELILVSNPGSSDQRVLRLPLGYNAPSGVTPVETDDTVFATSSQGLLLFADKGLNMVLALHKKAFAPGTAYTAADGGPFVGTINMTSGVITPVVTGLVNPGGMAFVDSEEHEGDRGYDIDRRDDEAGCRNRDGDQR